MDDQRVGAAMRAVRIRHGWRQADIAARARTSPGVVSLLERGHLEPVSMRAFRRVAGALEIRVDLVLRLPHGELDRLLNAGHAEMHEAIARYLDSLPEWLHAPEVSFAIYGERGVIDILAFHPPTGSLLVIELKTEFVSLEDLLTTMDVRLRHAARIAAERGWPARTINAWVVFADSATNRRRVRAHDAALRSAFPADGRQLRGWLKRPAGSIRGLSMWANFNDTTARRSAAGRRRVRLRGARSQTAPTRATFELA